jgi:hypothetical protein
VYVGATLTVVAPGAQSPRMVKHHWIAFVAAVALAACGGKKPEPAPTNSSDTTTTTDTSTDIPATPGEDERDAEGRCCCELPSDPASFELQDGTLCHQDSHGVCVALTKCGS